MRTDQRPQAPSRPFTSDFLPEAPPPAPGPAHVVAVDVAVGQHHGRVVLVHHVARDLADQAGVGAVGHGQGLRQLVQGAAAHGAVGAAGAAVLLVALPVRVKEGSGDGPLQQAQAGSRILRGRDLGLAGTRPEAEGPRVQSPLGAGDPHPRVPTASRREHAHGPGWPPVPTGRACPPCQHQMTSKRHTALMGSWRGPPSALKGPTDQHGVRVSSLAIGRLRSGEHGHWDSRHRRTWNPPESCSKWPSPSCQRTRAVRRRAADTAQKDTASLWQRGRPAG